MSSLSALLLKDYQRLVTTAVLVIFLVARIVPRRQAIEAAVLTQLFGDCQPEELEELVEIFCEIPEEVFFEIFPELRTPTVSRTLRHRWLSDD